MKEQFAQLQKIDTLVAAGVKVRRLDLVPQFANVTPVTKDERFFSKDEKGDRMYRKYHRVQLPWCKTLFVFNFETKVVLLDLATNQLRDQVDLEIPWCANSILLDVENQRIGLLSGEGKLKIFSLENYRFKLLKEYESNILHHGENDTYILPQIYGNFIIKFNHLHSFVEWYSLDSYEKVHEIRAADDSNTSYIIKLSLESPTMYMIIEENPYEYFIKEVDCTLGAEEKTHGPFSYRVSYDNCSDGVRKVNLIERNGERQLSMHILGTGDRCIDLYDLNSRKFSSWFADFEMDGYTKVQFFPGSPFYSITKTDYDSHGFFMVDTIDSVFTAQQSIDNNEVGVDEKDVSEDENEEGEEGDVEADEENDEDGSESEEDVAEDLDQKSGEDAKEDEKQDQEASSNDENFPDEDSETKEFYRKYPDMREDPDAYFSHHFKGVEMRNSAKWLSEDAISFKLLPGIDWKGPIEIDRQMFFSVSKKQILGYIEDYIENIYVMYDSVALINRTNQIYVVSLDSLSSSVPSDSKKRKLTAEDTNNDDHVRKQQKN
jgi:hypothetical protein